MKDKLKTLAIRLFNEDCSLENLNFKTQEIANKIKDIEQEILHYTCFPKGIETHELGKYVLRITPKDICVYHIDQYEKEEGMFHEKL